MDLHSGARFYSCALQVNPFEYLVRYSKSTEFTNEAAYNDAVVEACLVNGIEVVGITDHYRIKSSRTLIAKAREAGLLVLPGFEAVTKDGVHFICLFDTAADEDAIERRIGDCGIGSDDEASPIGSHDALEFMERCNQWKAICIAAHVAAAGGLLKTLRGQSAINAWRSTHLLACGLPGPVRDAPANLRPILENKNPDYGRERPVAVLNAQDVNDPADLAKPGFSTAIKMSDVGYEGVKQAFLDPESRIRLPTDPEPQEHTEFVAIQWTGGFLDGAAIHFNENLNALVGGRGSGKSTVIESVRYVLGLQPVGQEAQKAHDTIVRQVLRPGTQISLILRSPHPAMREYLVERTVPNQPTVKSPDGELLPLTPQDVAPRVEVFGQHEISELARSPEERTRLLERFLEAEVDAEKAELAGQLAPAGKRLRAALSRLTDIDERLAALPGITETLKRYQEAGLEEKLKEKSLLVREEAVLNSADETISSLDDALGELDQALPLNRDFVSSESLTALPNAALLSELETTVAEVSRVAEEAVKSIRGAVGKGSTRARELRQQWDELSAAADTSYEETLRELQKTNINGEEFIRLRRRIEQLTPLREEREKVTREIEAAKKARDRLTVAYEDEKAKDFRALESAAKQVTRRLKGRVRVKVRFQGNLEPLLELLRERVGGRLIETHELLRAMDTFSLRAFADAGRKGKDALAREFGLPTAQAARIAEAGEETMMAIEELDLPPTTQLELNVAPAGDPERWQAPEDLSAGQKATAVLLLLLLESDAPLVVDQPEDDLDNRFITEDVVPKMREEKRRRQFLFSTHNANIPVLGDAELIVGLSASGTQAAIRPDHLGSIDVASVRELVEEVLEGGKAAFELRRLKYGF
jgi:hypothetical protein